LLTSRTFPVPSPLAPPQVDPQILDTYTPISFKNFPGSLLSISEGNRDSPEKISPSVGSMEGTGWIAVGLVAGKCFGYFFVSMTAFDVCRSYW